MTKQEPKDRIEIRDLTDNLDRIDFKHHCTCAHCGHTEVQDVTIFRPRFDDYEGHKLGWIVIFSGALDFDGNKKDMLKRYPEFRGITSDLTNKKINRPKGWKSAMYDLKHRHDY